MAIPKILKNSFIYSIVSVFQKAISFFLLPLYTYYLTPTDYGILNIITTLSSFLSILFMLSLNGSASRFHYQNINSEKRIKLIWSTTIIFIVANSIVLGSIIILGHKFLLDPFVKGIPFYPFILLGMITTVLNPLYLLFQSYLQTRQEGKNYGKNAFIYSIINIGFTVLFLVVFKLGLIGILYANLLTSLIFLVYVIFYFIPRIKLVFSNTVLKHSMEYALPLVPHSLAGWLTAMVDRFFINSMIGTAQVGIYSIGFQFGNILNIVTGAVTQAYAPWFFEKLQKGEQGIKDIVKFSEFMTIFYCIVALGISFFSKEVLQLMVTEKFREGWRVIPFISFAYVFNGIYAFYIATLFIKKTKYVPIVTFSSAFISVIMNIILIPRIGVFGAAISNIISFAFSSVIALLLSIKFRKDINHNWVRIYTFTILFFSFSLITFIPVSLNLLQILLLKIFIFAIILLITLVIYKDTIRMLRNTFLQTQKLEV